MQIRIVNTVTLNPLTLTVSEGEIVNFGTFKEAVAQLDTFEGFNWNNARIIYLQNNEQKVVANDSDRMPASGNYTVYVTPTKVDSGNGTRYNDGVLKDVKTKINNIFLDLLGCVPCDGEDFVEEEGISEDTITEEEAAMAERIRRGEV